jgi:hypothetical protein
LWESEIVPPEAGIMRSLTFNPLLDPRLNLGPEDGPFAPDLDHPLDFLLDIWFATLVGSTCALNDDL